MAKKTRKAPADGPDGIDRWGTNGYGLEVDGKPVPPVPQEMDPVEEEEDLDEIEEV